MLDVMTLSPTVGSLRAAPLSVAEIDAHPDADRIWATISAMRAEFEGDKSESYDAGREDAKADEDGAFNEGRSRCADDLDDCLRKRRDDIPADILTALDGLAEEWRS